jgi:hypothetical protein
MKTMTCPSGRIWLLALAAGALFWAGCNTVPKTGSPEAGYLISRYWVEVKGGSDQASAMNSYARVIAEAKLRTLAHGDNLPALRRHLRELQTPVTISATALDAEANLSNSKRRAISAWLQSDPRNSAFDGAKVSDEWQQELARTEKQIQQWSGQFTSALAQARQAAAAGLFEEAAQAAQTALRLDPENADAQTANHDIYRNWATAKYIKLFENLGDLRSDVAAKAQNYESDHFSAAQIQDCESKLNEAQLQLDTFRAWCRQNPDAQQILAQRETELQPAETQLSGLRGTAWAQKMWLARRLHHYWDAYQQFLADAAVIELDLGGNQKHPLLDYEISSIHERIRQAYERMLPEGMEFYLKNAAGAAEGQGANGLSLVLCRMAQELLEFAEAQHMKLAPEVETKRAALNLSLNNSQKALKAGLARQLVVKDFQSRGDIGQVLAGQIYDEWLKRYPMDVPADHPVPFWMLDIKREAETTNAYDYVLNGSVKQCYADTMAPKELNVERLEIGQEPQTIPNPDPKQAKKIPTIFEQELWIYEKRISQFAKKAIIRADITVAFGGKVASCASINEEFDDTQKKLPNIKLLDLGIEHRAINYKPKRSPDREELKVDHLPPNKSAELSSDREIEAALIDYAKNQVLTNLEVFAALFPLNNLLQNAIDNASDPVKSAEWFGECLEYCSQLAALDKKLAAHTEKNWIDWRQATAERIAALRKEQWSNADPALAAEADHLWELAVASAIQAADQMTHSE